MTAARAPRLGALDLLRGLAVAGMIIVNNPGNWNAVFGQLSHAAWNGLTVADCIFPVFIFIMGVALGLAPSPGAASPRVRDILTRGALLIAMGLLLNLAAAWPAVALVRVPGVLQRIGLTYIVTALLLKYSAARTQAGWAVALLVVQTLMLRTGSLAPGANLAVAVDRAVFGSHMLSPSGDPEGLLGLPTAVVTALLGTAAARQLRHDLVERARHVRHAAMRLTASGAAAVLVGLASAWIVPVNKALWTAAFTLVTGGVAALGLAVCLVVTSTCVTRAAAPFFWLGTNPLAIYFLAEFTTVLMQRPLITSGGHAAALKDLIYWDLLVPLVGDDGGRGSSVLYAVTYALLWMTVAGLMRWRGMRVRV